MKQRALLMAVLTAWSLFAEGEPKMPTLNWMGREKATKSVKDVVMKILREDKALGKCCQCANVGAPIPMPNWEMATLELATLPQWQH